MRAYEIVKILIPGAHVYYNNGLISTVEFKCNGNSIYFRSSGSYNLFDLSKDGYTNLDRYCHVITRIDHPVKNGFITVWTVENGYVASEEGLVKLGDDYYSISFLTKAIKCVNEIRGLTKGY